MFVPLFFQKKERKQHFADLKWKFNSVRSDGDADRLGFADDLAATAGSDVEAVAGSDAEAVAGSDTEEEGAESPSKKARIGPESESLD